MKDFRDIFGTPAEAHAAAPGRVNLLGEHTDYNEGFVLPASIPQHTRVGMRRARASDSTLYSANLDQTARWGRDTPPEAGFARYVYGCVAEAGLADVALDVHVDSDVPIGVGLSSSAALEIATLRALRDLFALPLDDVEIARIGQRAEIRHAGVQCGILDQMACSLLTSDGMLYLDTRTLERARLPLPPASELLVIDSGLSRSLAASKYNERRAQCETASRLLGVKSLRDVNDPQALARLPAPLDRRARHVVSENDRVQRARAADAVEFGRLMSASHRSLSEDYEVSVPQLDRLAALLQADASVYGAKLTGAGFGGACVALCQAGSAAAAGARIVARYRSLGGAGRLLVPARFDPGGAEHG